MLINLSKATQVEFWKTCNKKLEESESRIWVFIHNVPPTAVQVEIQYKEETLFLIWDTIYVINRRFFNNP